MTSNEIHIVGILRDSKTKEFRSYTAIKKDKSLEEVQKLVDKWNENPKNDSFYTLSQDADLIDVIKRKDQEPSYDFLEEEIKMLDDLISSLEYQRCELQEIQNRREEQQK